MAHRDIKLDNIIVKDDLDVALIDFDLAEKRDDIRKVPAREVTLQGTKGYFPPELWLYEDLIAEDPNIVYDLTKSDTFSYGVMLFQLVTGLSPFEQAVESDGLYNLMGKGTKKSLDAFWSYLPEGCGLSSLQDEGVHFRDLIEKLLTPEPTERLCIEEIKAHPWFTNYSPSTLAAKT